MTVEGLDLAALIIELKSLGELNDEELNSLDALKAVDRELELPGDAAKGDDTQDIRSALRDMSISQKIKLAMFGNGTCRSLLIADRSKLVQACVLRNPKLQITEVQEFAKNPNLTDLVLRTIADKKEWMKTYAIKLAIVVNPKTPPDVALRWLRYVQHADLKNIARSKNVPQLISVSAKKRLTETEKR